MKSRGRFLDALLCVAFTAFLTPSFALDASDIPHLKVGAVLVIADSAGRVPMKEVSITHVHPVRSDNSVWYQINGISAGEQEEVMYADLNATPPKLEGVIRRISLRMLVDRPRKFLDAVEENKKGELSYEGVVFQYNDAESDDGFFETDGNKSSAFEFNYLVFTSSADANASIQVMRWSDEKLDAYLVRNIRATDVKLKQ